MMRFVLLAALPTSIAAPCSAQMPGGKPIPAVMTEQKREVDRIMVEELGIALVQMMENAGHALALVAGEQVGGTAARRRVLLAALSPERKAQFDARQAEAERTAAMSGAEREQHFRAKRRQWLESLAPEQRTEHEKRGAELE